MGWDGVGECQSPRERGELGLETSWTHLDFFPAARPPLLDGKEFGGREI